MKISRLVTGAVVAAVAISVAVAGSVSFAGSNDQTKEQVTLSGTYQKQQFLAGRRVEVKAAVADDIFAAGRDLRFDGASAENIIAAGGSLTFNGVSADDMILAGGQMEVTANVTDDIVAAVCPFCPFGGRLSLKSDTRIGDDARLAGREIDIAAQIGGDLYATGRRVTLSGEIAGDANIEAERIVLEPGARIGGDLIYASPSKPEIPEGVVEGQVRQVEMTSPLARGFPKFSIWYGIFAALIFVLAAVLLVTALQLAMPHVLSSAAATARSKPWSSIGRGFVLALLTPAVVALLMATIIGIPIGVVVIAGFLVLLTLAKVAIAYCIGLFVRGLFPRTGIVESSGSRIVWTVLGILVLLIVGLVPFVGWAIWMLAMVAGLGAVVSQLGPVFRRPDASAAPA